VNELYDALARIAGVNLKPKHDPARPGEQRRSVILPERAARQLDWRPEIALADGLGSTLGFFRERASR
jgi:UDP-glucose 4-epimerase